MVLSGYELPRATGRQRTPQNPLSTGTATPITPFTVLPSPERGRLASRPHMDSRLISPLLPPALTASQSRQNQHESVSCTCRPPFSFSGSGFGTSFLESLAFCARACSTQLDMPAIAAEALPL